MDNQSRIGIGASAMIAVILCFVPLLGWFYAGLAIFACALVALWGLWPLGRAAWSFAARHENWIRKAAVVCGLLLFGIGVGGLLGSGDYVFWAVAPNMGPIVWNFEDTARGRGYFLDLQKPLQPPNQEIVVAGFGAHGKNITAEPITDFDGYLRSDKNNEHLPIRILAANASIVNACSFLVPTLPQDTLGIPAFADFNVSTSEKPIFLNRFEGMPLSRFLNEFVPFTIVTTYGGKLYQRHFTREEVDRQVAILEKAAAPSANPYVIRKTTAPVVTVIPPPLTTLIPPNATPIPPDVTGKVPEK